MGGGSDGAAVQSCGVGRNIRIGWGRSLELFVVVVVVVVVAAQPHIIFVAN